MDAASLASIVLDWYLCTSSVYVFQASSRKIREYFKTPCKCKVLFLKRRMPGGFRCVSPCPGSPRSDR
jgi:hypothetical protein